MDKKILYFDTETTGLSPEKNDIIQLAYLIEINGKIVASGDIRCQPHSYENSTKEALEIHGYDLADMKLWQTPQVAHKRFVSVLEKHCSKYDKADKYYSAGYNVGFDVDFLAEWFKKCEDKYLGSFLNWKRLDPLNYLHLMDFKGAISLENYRLDTICAYFGIEIRAHDALSDITATRELFDKLMEIVDVKEFSNAARSGCDTPVRESKKRPKEQVSRPENNSGRNNVRQQEGSEKVQRALFAKE